MNGISEHFEFNTGKESVLVVDCFLLGTLAPSITEGQAFAGMLAGLVVMTVVWGWTPIAFTWYIFIGATTTAAIAWLAHVASARSRVA